MGYGWPINGPWCHRGQGHLRARRRVPSLRAAGRRHPAAHRRTRRGAEGRAGRDRRLAAGAAALPLAARADRRRARHRVRARHVRALRDRQLWPRGRRRHGRLWRLHELAALAIYHSAAAARQGVALCAFSIWNFSCAFINADKFSRDTNTNCIILLYS